MTSHVRGPDRANAVRTAILDPMADSVDERLAEIQTASNLARWRLLEHAVTKGPFEATDAVFGLDNALAGLAGSGIVCPPPGPELLRKYLLAWEATA